MKFSHIFSLVTVISSMNVFAETDSIKNSIYERNQNHDMDDLKKNNIDFFDLKNFKSYLHTSSTTNTTDNSNSQKFFNNNIFFKENENNHESIDSKKNTVDFFRLTRKNFDKKSTEKLNYDSTINMSPHDRLQYYINNNDFSRLNKEIRNQETQEKYKRKRP
ncbi:hypothetical protein [Acinetobacter guillouiae]|uniref:hypothetical protein n=1 Tax=Acinetobacter guillouiae TaxID=106649 RepID=UPI0028E9502E|nr:hypothetical protein [Acinetobacter guillouiae]